MDVVDDSQRLFSLCLVSDGSYERGVVVINPEVRNLKNYMVVIFEILNFRVYSDNSTLVEAINNNNYSKNYLITNKIPYAYVNEFCNSAFKLFYFIINF